MNQKNLWIALIMLIVAIFVFAQVYILFAVTQTNNRLVQLEDRIDKRFTEIDKRITDMEARFDKRFNLIENRLEALNQNYINHLAHHIGKQGNDERQ